MRIHDDWATGAYDAAPVAPGTGPFVGRELQRAWWEHRAPAGARPALVEGDAGLLPLVATADGYAFVGEPDLFDYHSPLGTGIPKLVAEFADSRPPGTRFRLDSLPWEAADLMRKGFAEVGSSVEIREHEAAAVIDLPESYDAYLAALGKKDRHEVRRKGRRFEAQLGPGRLVTTSEPHALADFIRLHRAAAGEKGSFMTGAMARFFGAALDVAGARLDVLELENGRVVAASLGFADDGGYYLYNSAYDPDAADASPGIVLLALLIERTIESGLQRFDFLKGEETYKYRLGAARRPLFVIEGTA